MRRTLSQPLSEFLGRKILLLSGPRQVGKTTLAQSLSPDAAYYNYDVKKDLAVFRDHAWDRSKRLVIFDELHRMKKWKLWLKGIYDEGTLRKQAILVTGSARLDVAQKLGDSLAGRFFSFRLHPLDLKELHQIGAPGSAEEHYERLMRVGGFPEPFFDGTDRFYGLWSKSHFDVILRQDLVSAQNVRDLDGIETLVELLSQRVGSTVSFNALREDLGRDDKTIKRWVQHLENLFVIFGVRPYSKNVARGLTKATKYYFYDLARVQGSEAAKLENLAALALRKEADRLSDVEGVPTDLFFGQTKEKREMDFIVEQKRQVRWLIEVKLSDSAVSPHFDHFSKFFPSAKKLQMVRNLTRAFDTQNGVRVAPLIPTLRDLQF